MTSSLCSAQPSPKTQERRFLASVLDGLFEGVVIVDAAGKVAALNAGAAAIAHVRADAAIGRPLCELPLTPAFAATLREAFEGARACGHAVLRTGVPGYGVVRELEFAARGVRAGAECGVLITIREKESDAAWGGRESRSAVDAADKTAGRTAHDMNNVLSAIMANAYILRQEAPDCPEVAKCVEAIERSVQAGARIVADAEEQRRARLESAAADAPRSGGEAAARGPRTPYEMPRSKHAFAGWGL